jgi:hypothetical protein
MVNWQSTGVRRVIHRSAIAAVAGAAMAGAQADPYQQRLLRRHSECHDPEHGNSDHHRDCLQLLGRLIPQLWQWPDLTCTGSLSHLSMSGGSLGLLLDGQDHDYWDGVQQSLHNALLVTCADEAKRSWQSWPVKAAFLSPVQTKRMRK